MTPTPSLEELLPCPLCEAPVRFVWGRGDVGSVKCTRPSCGARGGSFDHKANAIAAWNRRPLLDSLADAERERDEARALSEIAQAQRREAMTAFDRMLTRALTAEKRLEQAVEVVAPFAEVCRETYDHEDDRTKIAVRIGHLRAARSFLDTLNQEQAG